MAKSRLRDILVDEVSFVGRAAQRDPDDSTEPMRFLLWKDEQGCGCADDVEKAELTSKERDALPDSAFADPENRRYPIKRKDGSWDKPHIANARSRCADPANSCGPQIKKRIDDAARAAGIGDDNSSVKKHEEVTDVDLKEALAVIARATGNTQVAKDEEGEDQPGDNVLQTLLKDDNMPAAVREYLTSVEDRLTRLQKTEAFDDESDEVAQILKEQGVLPAVRSRIAKAEERAKEAEEQVKLMKRERAEEEARADLTKAEGFIEGLSYLGVSDGSRTELAKALFLLRRETPEGARELEKVLKSQDTKQRTSALWSELGIAGPTGRGFGSAKAELTARATELRKAEKDLTLDGAKARVLDEDADLAQRLDEEGIDG